MRDGPIILMCFARDVLLTPKAVFFIAKPTHFLPCYVLDRLEVRH